MSEATKEFKVTQEETDMRLDLFLAEKLSITRSAAKKMVDDGGVIVNEKKPKKAGDILKEGSVVEIIEIEKQETEIDTTVSHIYGEVEIISETPEYIVVFKPAGLLVHPTQADEPDTLSSRLLEKYPDIAGVGDDAVRPGIVHRLDKEASGILVVARTQKSFEHLKNQFKQRTVDKYYEVLVYGIPDMPHDSIDFEIDRGRDGRMVSRPKTDKLRLKNVTQIQPGKEALSEYWIEKTFSRFSLLKVKIHTGRTHQIRVHLFAYGHPVVGDPLYNNIKLVKKSDTALDRIFLHARELSFDDMSGERVTFVRELPEELLAYLETLAPSL